jgi:hypothetical protein
MKILLFVWKEGVVDWFGQLAASLRSLGHEAILSIHPRSRHPVSYEGRLIKPEPLARVLDRHRPGCVILWNGDLPLDDEVKAECHKRAIPVLHSEMAWFPQAETLYFDWEGVNGSSSIRRASPPRLSSSRRRELQSFLERYHALMGGNAPAQSGSQDFLLVPLQVENDSAVLKYSPVKSMAEFVAQVHQVFPDADVVVRPHPKATTPLFPLPPRYVYSDPAVGLHQLLSQAKGVVALNSTVVLEALTYFKPVVTFGEGVFSGHGAVVEAARSTPREMRAFVGRPIDDRRRERIATLLYELIFRRTFYSNGLRDPANVRTAAFYSEMLRLSRRGPSGQLSDGAPDD